MSQQLQGTELAAVVKLAEAANDQKASNATSTESPESQRSADDGSPDSSRKLTVTVDDSTGPSKSESKRAEAADRGGRSESRDASGLPSAPRSPHAHPDFEHLEHVATHVNVHAPHGSDPPVVFHGLDPVTARLPRSPRSEPAPPTPLHRPPLEVPRYFKIIAMLHWEPTLLSVMFLVGIQMHMSLVESVYSQNLVSGFIDSNVSAAAGMISPLALVLTLNRWFDDDSFGPVLSGIMGFFCLIFRYLTPFYNVLSYPSRATFSAVSCAFWWLWFAITLADASEQRISPADVASSMGQGLALGTVFSILLKTLGGSVDLSMSAVYRDNGWQPALGILLCALGAQQLVGFAIRRYFRFELGPHNVPQMMEHDTTEAGKMRNLLSSPARELAHQHEELNAKLEDAGHPRASATIREIAARVPPAEVETVFGISRVFLLAIGVAFILVLFTVVISNPQSVVRWAVVESSNGALIDAAILLQFCVLAVCAVGVNFISSIKPIWLRHFIASSRTLSVVNTLFVVFLVIPSYLQTPEDPIQRDSRSQIICLFIAMAMSPVLIFDFISLVYALLKHKPSPRQLGLALAIGAFFSLMSLFLLVFTYNYANVEEAGFWRGKYWQVILLMAFLSITFVSNAAVTVSTWADNMQKISRRRAVIMIVALGIAAFVAQAAGIGVWTAGNPENFEVDFKQRPSGQIRILTYNVHVGASRGGDQNWAAMFEEIKNIDPDVMIMPESETTRFEAGAGDIVWYMSQRLKLKHSHYGAMMGTGTFGVAILSRFPLKDSKVHLLWSTTITGQRIALDEEADLYYTLFGCHITNSIAPMQVAQILALAEPEKNVIIGGDFNFGENSDVFKSIDERYPEGWLTVNPSGIDKNGYGGESNEEYDARIDHVFLAPEIAVTRAEFFRWKECAVCVDHRYSWDCRHCSASDHLPSVYEIQFKSGRRDDEN